MTTVCQKCGVSGFEELLFFCKKCQTSAEHRYCLDKMPKPGEVVHWLCEQCITSVPKVDTKGSKGHHHHEKNLASRLQQITYHHLENTYVGETSSNVDDPMNDTSHCLEEDTLNVGTSAKTSKSMDLAQVDLLFTSKKKGVHQERENHEHLGNEIVQGRKANRRRKLILDDDSDDKFIDEGVPRRSSFQVNRPFTLSTLPQHRDNGTAQPDASLSKFAAGPDTSLLESAADRYSHCPVSPVVHPVWRGYFNVCDRKFGPIMAHLSNRACEKVCNAADILPKVLHFKRLPRLEAWPKSFECSAPTDDNIALYFFPGDARAKAVLDQLLYDVINEDLVLKIIIGEAELLVFSSMLLPQRCLSFEGEYYLWGVFRAQQAPRPRTPDNHFSTMIQPASVEECEHYNVLKDVAASHLSRLNDGIEGSEDDDVFMGPQAPSCGIPDTCAGSQSPKFQVPYEHFSKSSEDMEEPVEETGYPFSRKEVWSPCFPADKSSNFTEVITLEQGKKNSDGNVELNFNVEHERYGDGSLAACLVLFPLGVEDLAIATKVQGSDDVDLDLRLKPVKERNQN